MQIPPTTAEDFSTRQAQVEEQMAKKQGQKDRRSASFQALLKECVAVQAHIHLQEKGCL